MIRDDTNGEQDLMLLRRYLLGQLDVDAREELEDRLWPATEPSAEDRLLSELLQVAEDSIIDDYQLGSLSYEDRTDAALRFSWTPLRREKLQLATGLTRLAEAAEAQPVSVPAGVSLPAPRSGSVPFIEDSGLSEAEPWRLAGILPWIRGGDSNRWSMPAWAPAAAALLLVVSIAVAFQFGANLQADSSTAFLALDPAARMEGGTPTIEARGELLRLQLETGGVYDGYQAELYRGNDTEHVLRTGTLALEPYENTTVVGLSLPTELLAPGDYHVLLHGIVGEDTPKFLTRFDFVIRD